MVIFGDTPARRHAPTQPTQPIIAQANLNTNANMRHLTNTMLAAAFLLLIFAATCPDLFCEVVNHLLP